jgi:hypothetical protein
MVRISAKMAWNVMPMRRNGRDKSQIRGKTSKAITANGQQRTKRMHQATKRINVFIFSIHTE